MIQIYGTIGPSCADPQILRAMFEEGMTGIRLNTSHVSVQQAAPQIDMILHAAAACGVEAKLLIDMQGPELRIGRLASPLSLTEGASAGFRSIDDLAGDAAAIPVPQPILDALTPGAQVLLDDGRLLLEMTGNTAAAVVRGGLLASGKSIALPGTDIQLPAMTDQDLVNIQDGVRLGITGVMQPFVRSADDLLAVRSALDAAGGQHVSLLAKIENLSGVRALETFFPLADEIVIARGDLGNAMPLWQLPALQKDIAARCRAAGKPFMVVTQMLQSMLHSAVPTRAEVSDIYNAACDGAASVMVTGETAAGDYPVQVIRYLSKTIQTYSA